MLLKRWPICMLSCGQPCLSESVSEGHPDKLAEDPGHFPGKRPQLTKEQKRRIKEGINQVFKDCPKEREKAYVGDEPDSLIHP